MNSLRCRSTLATRAASGVAALLVMLLAAASTAGCKRSEPPPELLKTQRDAMDKSKDVGNTMQKSVDAEGKKADEEGR